MTTIALNNGRGAGAPLPTLTVGRGSALELEVAGAPDGLQSLQLHVSDAETPHTYTPVAATPLPGNVWRAYAGGLNFRTPGRAFYQLTGRDARDGNVWLGKGWLNIEDCVLHRDDADVPIVPEDCYIRNPATGLWHKVTATMDDGEIVLQYEKEGIEK